MNTYALQVNNQPDISIEAERVRQALIDNNLETPMIDNGLTDLQKYNRIRKHMAEVMEVLGLDLKDDSLAETPHRIAKMYVHEVFHGLNYETFPRISVIENKMGSDEMVKVSDIELTSTCEHHFVTIDGKANVAYIPNDKIIGLSKLNRLVQFFAKRPQVQERLNRQVLVALQTLLDTPDVAVSIDATHYCVKSRGVQDSSSFTSTMALGGEFKLNPDLRREFLK